MSDITITELEETKRGVAAYDWYHTIDLGHGIVTPELPRWSEHEP